MAKAMLTVVEMVAATRSIAATRSALAATRLVAATRSVVAATRHPWFLARFYLPLKLGFRFSLNARTPSSRSSVVTVLL